MNTTRLLILLASGWALLLPGCSAEAIEPADAPTNQPPRVSILWPRSGLGSDRSFVLTTLIKIKVDATDADGFVSRVEFFVQTNLIGVATGPPFTLLWGVGVGVGRQPGWPLKAVAVDNLGARGESAIVPLTIRTGPPSSPVMEMISPREGAIFPAPASFEFSAEVLASACGDAGPVAFYAGTNQVGLVSDPLEFRATTPPASVTVSNLAEGDYPLTVAFLGGNGMYCNSCLSRTNHIRVVRLSARAPVFTPDRRLQFEVVTSLPGRETIIDSSADLLSWLAVSTNRPATNRFLFTEPAPPSPDAARRFYRIRVAPE